MAEWNFRSAPLFSDADTPPIRGRSLAPSTRYPSRSRSSCGSSPPPEEEDLSEGGGDDGEYEEEEEDGPQLLLLDLEPEEERGKPAESSQAFPEAKEVEVVNPRRSPPSRGDSSEDLANRSFPEEFLDAIGLSPKPVPSTESEALPPAVPYFNPLQSNPHHNPFLNTAQQTGLSIPRSHPPLDNLANQLLLPSTGPLSAPEHIPLSNTAHQITLPQNKHKPVVPSSPPFPFENMAARLLNPIEHILQAGGYKTPIESSSQHRANQPGDMLSPSEVEGNQLMFNWLAEIGSKIAKSAKHKPLLKMDARVFSTTAAKDEERRLHLEDIGQIEGINKTIDTGISTCESMIERLRLLRQTNVERINYTLSYLSIIRRLPLDVMYLIFDCCVYDAEVSPWTLIAVSKQFRHVAKSYRKIWASIHVETCDIGNDRYVGFHEVCRNLRQLDMALKRSGSFPLTLRIRECSKEMAQRLVRDRLRWANIGYESALNSPIVEKALFNQTFTQAEKDAAIGISSLAAGIHWRSNEAGGTYFSKWIKHHTPRQISFTWKYNFIVPTIPQNAPLKQRWWRQLSSLELVYLHQRGPHSYQEATTALEILKQTRGTVTELKLGHVRLPIMTDRLHLPNLRKLSLIEVREWWNIIALGVTELELSPCRSGSQENGPQGSPPQDTTASFPELNILRYTAMSYDMRGVLSAPKLDFLEYHTGKSEPGFIWESGYEVNGHRTACLKPKKLHMYDVQVRYAVLLNGMRTLKDLEEIHLYSSQLRSGFLKPLAGKLLTNVTEIVLELATGNGVPEGPDARQKYTEMFEKIAEARKGDPILYRNRPFSPSIYMKPLNRFMVKWPTEMGGGTTVFTSPSAVDTSVSQWSIAEVSPGRSCHTLAPLPVTG